MTGTPERELDPPEETIRNEPEFERDPLSIEYIDAQVLQIGMLPERIELALKDYREDNADMDIMVMLLEECQIELRQTQERYESIVKLSVEIGALTERLSNSTYGKVQA